jgi:hypothetical protein
LAVKSRARAFPRGSVTAYPHHTVKSRENMRFHASRGACEHDVSARELPPSRTGTTAKSQHNRALYVRQPSPIANTMTGARGYVSRYTNIAAS